jgi:hypothetical protein
MPRKPLFSKKVLISDAEITTITELMKEDAKTGAKTEKSKSQTVAAPPTKEICQTGDDATVRPPDLGSGIVERSPKLYLPELESAAMIANHATQMESARREDRTYPQESKRILTHYNDGCQRQVAKHRKQGVPIVC